MSPHLGSVLPSGVWAENAGERGPGGPALETSGDGQIELFAPRVVLARDMETALARGRFEEAGRLRLMFEETYPSPGTRDLGFLDRLGGRLWEGPPGVALSVWAEIDAHLRQRPHLRARLRDGVFARLLESHSPEALFETKPECLPALALVLASSPEIPRDDGRRRARGLIREALLAGRDLMSLHFKHDEPVADLLAEDLSPRWLACLGVLRRLWAAPRPDRFDLASFPTTPAEERSDDEAAREFWHCLCVAQNADGPDELVHGARRRMKQLRPEFHASYMKRALPTTAAARRPP